MNDINTIKHIYDWANKKRLKYQEEYQISGSSSAMKTYEKYEDICDICIAAEQGKSEEDNLRMHILKNQYGQIEALHDLKTVAPSKTFTYEDVEKWMKRMMI